MLIPFRDRNPSGTMPIVTMGLITVNVLAFLRELSLTRAGLQGMILNYGLVPSDVFHWRESASGDPGLPIRFLTCMFLHAGWVHLLGNMWYLWIFGDNIEDKLGHLRFLLFYLAGGIVASLAHVFSNPESTMPMIGASGAIAGVLGAYMVSFPGARVVSLFLFVVITVIEIPAVIVLGFWFLVQFFQGTASITGEASSNVAWWAHIGGFVAGMVLILLLPASERYRRRLRRYRIVGR